MPLMIFFEPQFPQVHSHKQSHIFFKDHVHRQYVALYRSDR